MYNNYFETYSINKPTKDTLKDKIVFQRLRFKQIFMARYTELLPSLIKYKNGERLNVDFHKVEIALRSGFDVVIGETVKHDIQVLGVSKSKQTFNDPSNIFNDNLLKKSDIDFIIPKENRLNYYKEISRFDENKSGNFVVLRNKKMNLVSDFTILEHYIDELAEISLSRFSMSMQVKMITLFLGEPNDESMSKLVNDIYNGVPYAEGSKLFDPDEQIYKFDNGSVANNFQELKREFQNRISELNNMLGVHSLAVEKESGVSDSEAHSNRGFTTSNANIYLDGRNQGLELLNKKYDLNIEAVYNDEVSSELQELSRKEEGGESDGNNNNAIQDHTFRNE